MPMASAGIRRAHKKSRHGCKECKRRHRKCDEVHPTCFNCSSANLRCSFLGLLPSPPASFPSPAPSSCSGELLAISPSAHSSTPSISHAEPSVPRDVGDPVFTLRDLELIHHAQSHLALSIEMSECQARRLWNFLFEHALKSPYLLDQLLALSAAHLSTLSISRRDDFRQQASRLQTRSLTLLNGGYRRQDADNEAMATFLHSSMLGLHLLFDTIQYPDESSVVLDKFISYLSIHRGVRAVLTKEVWLVVQSDILPLIGAGILEPIEGDDDSDGRELDTLTDLVKSSDLRASSAESCYEAIESLRWAFAVYRRDPKSCPQSASAWPIIIPAAFLDLLRQRRPEALVILAHYAVLMHLSRDFWVFGDGGRLIVGSISSHLGTFWERWLAWPNDEVNMVQRGWG
ncbi:hypothetical protein GGS24DRAFT_470868 [Hypoxylon argillaceum]|nr:hypothetical protein GGS24DRAFT_470868 [Hypoxylon argillaceum]